MLNHVHIIATPEKIDSLAKAIGRTQYIYAQNINRLHGRSGHLWHSRFYSCVLGDQHFLEAMRYIENNPVSSRMCRKPWDYEWSSAQDHIGLRKNGGIIDVSGWNETVGKDSWKTLLGEKINEGDIKNLQVHTRTGRPLGSDTFISKLETKIGRRLRALSVGRPKKEIIKNNRSIGDCPQLYI